MTDEQGEFYKGQFPADFFWGTGTGSYQIEGGWNEDGKGLSIWDDFTHTAGKVRNNDNGDVACDSYHQWREDIRCLQELGVSHYRFSVSWPRIMANGTLDSVNPGGIAYYHRVLDGLLAAGITPMIMLYHWDLPLALQKIGGWTNVKMVDYFTDFARICFQEYGEKVKCWITFNEPQIICWFGYISGEHAPGFQDLGLALKAGHTMILAHTKTYHLYHDEYFSKQTGEVGIVMSTDWTEAKDPGNPEDCAMAERFLQCQMGWFANPFFGDGDYPQLMKEYMELNKIQNSLESSLLPAFTKEEIKTNRGASDFVGLNNYATRLARPLQEGEKPRDEIETWLQMSFHVDPEFLICGGWMTLVPWGFRRLVKWVSREYNNPKIYITENGILDHTACLNDTHRVDFYKTNIDQILRGNLRPPGYERVYLQLCKVADTPFHIQAILEDGCDVRGYMAWTLMDSFDWASGYRAKFGLFHVDFNDTKRPRTAKKSAAFYKEVIENNGLHKAV